MKNVISIMLLSLTFVFVFCSFTFLSLALKHLPRLVGFWLVMPRCNLLARSLVYRPKKSNVEPMVCLLKIRYVKVLRIDLLEKVIQSTNFFL